MTLPSALLIVTFENWELSGIAISTLRLRSVTPIVLFAPSPFTISSGTSCGSLPSFDDSEKLLIASGPAGFMLILIRMLPDD